MSQLPPGCAPIYYANNSTTTLTYSNCKICS